MHCTISSRDLVIALVMIWILAISSGKKIAAYLSDITGAFDRVSKDYLMAKVYAAGVGSVYLIFLISYLQPRRATDVSVDLSGCEPDELALRGIPQGPSVFCGWVLTSKAARLSCFCLVCVCVCFVFVFVCTFAKVKKMILKAGEKQIS